MMSHDPWFCRRISLWTSAAIGTSARGKDSHAIAMSTDHVGFVERNPMLYSVSESFEADSGVPFVVGNDLTREETAITIL